MSEEEALERELAPLVEKLDAQAWDFAGDKTTLVRAGTIAIELWKIRQCERREHKDGRSGMKWPYSEFFDRLSIAVLRHKYGQPQTDSFAALDRCRDALPLDILKLCEQHGWMARLTETNDRIFVHERSLSAIMDRIKAWKPADPPSDLAPADLAVLLVQAGQAAIKIRSINAERVAIKLEISRACVEGPDE